MAVPKESVRGVLHNSLLAVCVDLIPTLGLDRLDTC
jgi:hypothetical protein